MTDRLEEIKRVYANLGVEYTLDGEDWVLWLIREVERLRAVPNIDKLLSGEMVAKRRGFPFSRIPDEPDTKDKAVEP